MCGPKNVEWIPHVLYFSFSPYRTALDMDPNKERLGRVGRLKPKLTAWRIKKGKP
jgi:hypothetical protein